MSSSKLPANALHRQRLLTVAKALCSLFANACARFAVCILWSIPLSASAMVVDGQLEEAPLYRAYEYYTGPDPSAQWQNLNRAYPPGEDWRPVRSRVFWPPGETPTLLRAKLEVATVLEQTVGFVVALSYLRDARLLLVDENGPVMRSALGVDVTGDSGRPGEGRLFATPLPLQPGSSYTLYVMLDNYGLTAGQIINASWLVDWEHHLQKARPKRSALVGVALGAVSLLLVFTATLLLLRRSLLVGSALTYLIGLLGSLVLREGLLLDQLVRSDWWLTDGMFFFITIRNIGVILFGAVILNVWRKRAVRVCVLLAVVGNAVAAVWTIGEFDYAGVFLGFSLLITMVNFLLLLVAALLRIPRGEVWDVVVGSLWAVYFFFAIYELFHPLFPNPQFDPELFSDVLLIVTAVWVYQAVTRRAVSDRQRLIRQRASNEARMDFLSRLSHEIRTPLNAIIGMSDVLKQGNMDNQQQHNLAVIANAGNTLVGLVNNILDFTRIESGEFIMKSAPFRLDSAALSACQTFNRQIYETFLGGHLVIAPEVPLCVIGDELRLRQVLINLIGNAFKYTEQGHVLIRIQKLGQRSDGKVVLHILVEDTGPGIPEEKLATLFDAFTRVEDEGGSRVGGTGLGLTICKRLVEMNGGRISVASQPGLGTAMSVSWPIAVDGEAEHRLRARWLPVGGKRFLAMIPEEYIADIIKPYLEHFGARVSWAPTIDAALELLGEERFDAAILDCVVGVSLDDPRLEQFLKSGIPSVLAIASDPDVAVPAFPNAIPQIVPTTTSHLMDLMVSAATEQRLVEAGEGDVPTRSIPALNVLVVDDNPLNLLVASQLLESLGVEAVTASSGAQALELLEAGGVDLVFMDAEMPEMDGFETTTRWRQTELERGLAPLPVFAFTAHSSADISRRADHSGMQGTLYKPVTRDRLRQLLLSQSGELP